MGPYPLWRLGGHRGEDWDGTPIPRTWGVYSPKIPIRVCAAQQGHDFGTPDLQWGIFIFKTFEKQVIEYLLNF